MDKILTAAQMKNCDQNTIEHFGVPGLVLMERAALSVCQIISNTFPSAKKIGIFCGPGNNGGDGVAIGRILHNKGYSIQLLILGDSKRFSSQLNQELEIAKNYGVNIISPSNTNFNEFDLNKVDLFIDALFGIGLTRGLSNEFEAAAIYMNQANQPVIAVDIPSGFDTDTGKLLGSHGVNADITVTFAYMKKGLVMGDCKSAAGNVIVQDVGIYSYDEEVAHIIDNDILREIPKRTVTANKGTCGKVLIIAGSENIYGACYLAANAALSTGSGLIKIYTHKNNILAIQENLPEAMYTGYDSFCPDDLIKELAWADTVVIGPGLGTCSLSKNILETVANDCTVPVVIDADGLNILSSDLKLLDVLSARVPVILTPHLKEMERLCGTSVCDINYDMEKVARDFSINHNCIVLLKNHTEVIADGDSIYYCCSGNEALATPGSGDVLAGIIGALLGQGLSASTSATVGAYLHGASGTMASTEKGIKCLLARDIITFLKNFL